MMNEQPELFTEHVVKEAKDFAEFLLKSFNELEGVAITLSWRAPLMNLPTAVIRGRNGALDTCGEATRMMEQLLGNMRYIQNKLDMSLQAPDKFMSERAAVLKTLEQEIEQRRADLDRIQNTGRDS